MKNSPELEKRIFLPNSSFRQNRFSVTKKLMTVDTLNFHQMLILAFSIRRKMFKVFGLLFEQFIEARKFRSVKILENLIQGDSMSFC